MECIDEIIDGCHVEAILIGDNKNACLTINVTKNTHQKAWIGKKVGDVLTAPRGLLYRVGKIYVGMIDKPIDPNPNGSTKGNIHTSKKKKNWELNNEPFDYDISGYGIYLFKRGYSSFAESGANSTCLGYAEAIIKICSRENLTFDELCQSVNHFAKEYSLDGPKGEYGKNGKGTWRNALNRLVEFVEYQRDYLHR